MTIATRRVPGFCTTALLLIMIAAWGQAAAAEDKPVLKVPASEVPLHLAVPAPQGTEVSPALVEVGDGAGPIPAEVIPASLADGAPDPDRGRIVASVPPRKETKGPRRFRLAPAKPGERETRFEFREVNETSLGLWEGDLPVMVYNHGMISKKGVPSRYDRACYIHPLYGLDGEVITEDFPTDHRHHRGVWWSWPHIKIEGKHYNSWIPSGIEYRHERWVCRRAGQSAAILAAENGWYTKERRVMREYVWMIVYPAQGDYRAIDIELTWTPLGKPIALQGAGGKSYGGLTVRFAQAEGQPKAVKRKDTIITVPRGVTKRDLPDTRLKWADITGHAKGAKGRSGIAVFVPPDHPDYPPTWLTRHYGPLCIGWPGVQAKTFPAGEPFRIRYRLWIHRGEASLERLKRRYAAYTSLADVAWQNER
jgi:hypothetical protein